MIHFLCELVISTIGEIFLFVLLAVFETPYVHYSQRLIKDFAIFLRSLVAMLCRDDGLAV